MNLKKKGLNWAELVTGMKVLLTAPSELLSHLGACQMPLSLVLYPFTLLEKMPFR